MAGRFGITAVYSVVTLHTAEMFPTNIRNSALGTSSTSSHVGSIMAPYVVDFLVCVIHMGHISLRLKFKSTKHDFDCHFYHRDKLHGLYQQRFVEH